MIKVENISKKFGENEVLSNISFTLKNGELVALIGEHGAGKSTLMRIISGYVACNFGQVTIFEKNIDTERLLALSHIGYVPEISALYGEMRVYDFLDWMARIWNIKNIGESIQNIAKILNIIDILNKPIETLSKGFKKRVEIASAIIHKPDFLILDEPTDGLDPNQRYEIQQFIKQYAKNHIVLISTHVLEDIDIANRVIMLSNGKIINDTNMIEFKKISHQHNLGEAFRILSKQPRKKK